MLVDMKWHGILAAIIIATVITTVGWLLWHAGIPQEMYCSSDSVVSDVALDRVYDALSPVLRASSGKITEGLIRAEQVRIDCVRAWAKKNTRGCIRYEYLRWIDSYERDLIDAKLKATMNAIPIPDCPK